VFKRYIDSWDLEKSDLYIGAALAGWAFGVYAAQSDDQMVMTIAFPAYAWWVTAGHVLGGILGWVSVA